MKKLISIAALVLIGMATAFADVKGMVIVEDIVYRVDYDGTATAISYNPSQPRTDVVVEDYVTYENTQYPVTKLNDDIFRGQYDIISVRLPATLQEISSGAFCDCISLSSIRIPDNVSKIGDEAFRNCHSLPSITLPDNLTSIADKTFCECSALTSISIPGKVETIGREAFRWCHKLTTVSQSAYIEEIGDYAFEECDKLEWNDFSRVGLIGKRAFSGCNISGTVIIDGAILSSTSFYGNTGIKRVMVNPAKDAYYDSAAFEKCSNIELFIIAHTKCKYFGAHFFAASNPNAVVISPISLNRDYDRLNLLNVVTYCDIDLDEICISDDLVVYDSPAKTKLWYAPVALPEIPSTVKEIADGALRRYPGALIIPENVVSIREAALYGNSRLKSITFPDHFTYLPAGLLYDCPNLEHVDLPSNLRTLSNNMFKYCKSLHEIQLPETLTSIAEQAFYSSGIRNIIIPKAVIKIRDEAFRNSELESIEFADGCELQSIGYKAFSGTNITSIHLPEKIASIDYCPFPKSLQEIYIPGTFSVQTSLIFCDEDYEELNLKKIAYNSMHPLEEGKYIFSDKIYLTCTLEIPVGSYARVISPWMYFKKIVENPDLAGVDDVTIDLPADDAPVEYYDMQGRRVEHPSSGLYIRRQGPKAEKVLLP